MKNTDNTINCEAFLNSKWREATLDTDKGYNGLQQGFQSLAQSYQNENKQLADLMRLLANICSMMLRPDSFSEPFGPFLKLSDGSRSTNLDDLTQDNLTFFATIINDIDDGLLKARLAELLWLYVQPRNISYVQAAMASYISIPITTKSWMTGADKCWARAIKLCNQHNDKEKLQIIATKLYNAFLFDDKDNPHMPWWIAKLFEQTKLCRDKQIDIATRLLNIGKALKTDGQYLQARSNLEISRQIFYRNRQHYEQDWLDCLIQIAQSHEFEGDEKVTQITPSQTIANFFYGHALQAYRKIPQKHRPQLNIEDKLNELQSKIGQTGKASLGEMKVIPMPPLHAPKTKADAKKHVSGKQDLNKALLHFTGFAGTCYESLKTQVNEPCRQNILDDLIFTSVSHASDGRTIGKIPPVGFNKEDEKGNQATLDKQILNEFANESAFIVNTKIIPALDQLQLEYPITREFLEKLCYHSPIVPEKREKLMAYALWHGFEYDFGNAIHLLSPQFEHLVRTRLKEAGAPTITIREGIETENGLSTLMIRPENEDLFGKDITFEIKALFTEGLGFNLRNNAAHGLLDDHNALSVGSVYAWWLVLKLIVWSMVKASSADE
jgi:hypothetical protein